MVDMGKTFFRWHIFSIIHTNKQITFPPHKDNLQKKINKKMQIHDWDPLFYKGLDGTIYSSRDADINQNKL